MNTQVPIDPHLLKGYDVRKRGCVSYLALIYMMLMMRMVSHLRVCVRTCSIDELCFPLVFLPPTPMYFRFTLPATFLRTVGSSSREFHPSRESHQPVHEGDRATGLLQRRRGRCRGKNRFSPAVSSMSLHTYTDTPTPTHIHSQSVNFSLASSAAFLCLTSLRVFEWFSHSSFSELRHHFLLSKQHTIRISLVFPFRPHPTSHSYHFETIHSKNMP